MEIGSIFVGLALLAVVAFILAQPFLENQGVRERQVTQVDALLAEREQVLDALRDLDFDHTMGKITIEDYTPQRALLLARGVELLKQIDAAGPPAAAALPLNGAEGQFEAQVEQAVAARRKARPAPLVPGAVGEREGVGLSLDPDAQIEAAIAARRKAAAEGTCSKCGTPAQAGDRFCAKCGSSLAQPHTCGQCGTALKAGDRFCGKCGARVADAAATGAA
jgi:hypothetical protein